MLTEPVATLGGCIASGISGPGRFRYGGLRDFIIGVKFIDGQGRLIHGGGKVVKNAAGFDFPKLMIGSYGRLGVLTEATFKVFPQPQTTLTAMVKMPLLTLALETLRSIARQGFDLDALELMPPGEVVIRIAGHAEALPPRLDAIRKATNLPWREMTRPGAAEMWRSLRQMEWVGGFMKRVRVPIKPTRVVELDEFLERHGVARLYSVGANVAWIAWPPALEINLLHQALFKMRLSGLQLDGSPVRLGTNPAAAAERIVKTALDPLNKFGSMP
jgi:glycolate oxidase FAD binding subunit